MRLALSIVAAFALAACVQQVKPAAIEKASEAPWDPGTFRASHKTMGTIVDVTIVWPPHKEDAQKAADEVFAEFDRLDVLMSEWKPESPLSKVNAAAGATPVEVPGELFDLIAHAQEVSKKSDGAFDITFAAMWGLWTFGDDGVNKKPDPDEVKRRLPLIDYRSVVLDEKAKTVFLPKKGMRIGLGGIAKGYAADRAVKILRKHGLTNFALKAGGELYIAGKKGDRPWNAGILDPRGDTPFAYAELTDTAFSTSGDYERYFMDGGVRYHHIIDPKTGYPATKSRSVTVLAPDCYTADGITKPLFILGAEKGLDLLKTMPGVEAVWVTSDNRVVTSPGMKDRLHVLHAPSD